MELLRYAYKQPNDWTCGPAVLRTVLHALGIQTDISELVRELKTTRSGTRHSDLIRYLNRNSYDFRIRQASTVPILKRYLRNHWVIVAYWIPRSKEFHYSIVKQIKKSRVYFHDTWYGTGHSYSVTYFSRNWFDDESKRWMLAIKK